MVNRHFGRAGDIWKHLLLGEVIDGIRPAGFAETHSGSAANLMVDDLERAYGVRYFVHEVALWPLLREAAYTRVVTGLMRRSPSVYPGSSLLALSLLDPVTDFLMCDMDSVSAADLRVQAHSLGRDRCTVAERDGMAAVADWLPTAPGPALVHIDPFDPHARVDSGRSALELAVHVAQAGDAVAYWYGYDNPDERSWPLALLAARTDVPLVSLDMAVLDESGAGNPGHLGTATTPGTGFGHVLANVPEAVVDRCARVGEDLAAMYSGAPLPSGEVGNWTLSVKRMP